MPPVFVCLSSVPCVATKTKLQAPLLPTIFLTIQLRTHKKRARNIQGQTTRKKAGAVKAGGGILVASGAAEHAHELTPAGSDTWLPARTLVTSLVVFRV